MMKIKAKILFCLSGFFLISTGIFAYPKIGTVSQVLGVFDGPFLWPSARTGIALFMNANRYGDEKQTMMDFWVKNYDILLDARPYEEIKTLSPNTKDFSVDSASYGTAYNADTNTYSGPLLSLKEWAEAHWQEYPWASQFASAEEAFEDCFIHVNQPLTVTFVRTTTPYTMTTYDPANPKPSRLIGPWDINFDWIMNVGSPVYFSYWQDYRAAQLTAGMVDGLYLDSTGGGWIHLFVSIDKTVEYISSSDYISDMRILTNAIKNSVHDIYPDKKLAINNYDYFETGVNPAKLSFEEEADLLWREGSLRYSKAADLIEKEIGAVSRAALRGKIVTMQQAVNFCSFADTVCVDRDRMAGLATYYLAMNDNVYFFSFGGDLLYSADPRIYSWFEALKYDIGGPQGNYYLFTQGEDPSSGTSPKAQYKIYARDFDRALVLLKPRPDWSATNYGNLSTTTHQLDGVYRRLNSDGTLGDPVASITLRNWEGAILLEQDTTAPAAVSNLSAQ